MPVPSTQNGHMIRERFQDCAISRGREPAMANCHSFSIVRRLTVVSGLPRSSSRELRGTFRVDASSVAATSGLDLSRR